MTHRRFSVKPPDERVAPTFTLDGPGWEESFTCTTSIPGAVLLNLAADISDKDRMARAVLDFLDACLADDDGVPGRKGQPDSLTRFKALINDRRRFVDMESLTEIAEFIGEVYAERPTQPPSG